MDKLDNKLNKFFSRIQFLSPWLIRLGLGIAFSIHGLSKFPLPSEAGIGSMICFTSTVFNYLFPLIKKYKAIIKRKICSLVNSFVVINQSL